MPTAPIFVNNYSQQNAGGETLELVAEVLEGSRSNLYLINEKPKMTNKTIKFTSLRCSKRAGLIPK